MAITQRRHQSHNKCRVSQRSGKSKPVQRVGFMNDWQSSAVFFRKVVQRVQRRTTLLFDEAAAAALWRNGCVELRPEPRHGPGALSSGIVGGSADQLKFLWRRALTSDLACAE